MKPKIILLDNVLAHYRKDVFKSLIQNTDFDFQIVAGAKYQGVKTFQIKSTTFHYKEFKFFNHQFYYLPGSIRHILKENPQAIICGGFDPHLIHTFIAFLLFRLILRIPFYWWTHGTIGNQGKMGYWFRKLVYKKSSGALAYSSAGKTNLLGMGLPENKCKVVNNAIASEEYGFLNYEIKKEKKNKFTILYSGRITLEKELEVLIKAINWIKINSLISNLECIIIGGGEHLKPIETLIEQYNLNHRIKCLRAKYGTDIHAYFLSADLYVYPGGIGLSLVHALSFGLPVLTTNNLRKQMPEFELLEPGFNGDLFLDENPESLADKILEWKKKIENDAHLYSTNCIDSIHKKAYLPDKVVNEICDFIKMEMPSWKS